MFDLSKWLCLFLVLPLLAGAGVAFADDDSDQPGAKKARGLERWDSDGDGKLSDSERAAARDANQGKDGGKGVRAHGDRAGRYDTDGDGVVSDAERAAGKAQRKQERAKRVEKYDKDGDGKLSKAEREEARLRGEKMGHPGKGGGPGKKP